MNCALPSLPFRVSETLLDTPRKMARPPGNYRIIRKNATACRDSRRTSLRWREFESGETRFDMNRFAEELLHDAEESFREIARTHGIDFQNRRTASASHPRTDPVVSRTPDADSSWLADREAINQTFANLIDKCPQVGGVGGADCAGSAPRPPKPWNSMPRLWCGHTFRASAALLRARLPVSTRHRSRESGGTGLGSHLSTRHCAASLDPRRNPVNLTTAQSVFTLPTA